MVKMPEQENYRVIKKSLCTCFLYCNHQVYRDFLITLYFDEQPCTVKQQCSYLLKCNGLQSEGKKTVYPDEIWICSDVGNKLSVAYCSVCEL